MGNAAVNELISAAPGAAGHAPGAPPPPAGGGRGASPRAEAAISRMRAAFTRAVCTAGPGLEKTAERKAGGFEAAARQFLTGHPTLADELAGLVDAILSAPVKGAKPAHLVFPLETVMKDLNTEFGTQSGATCALEVQKTLYKKLHMPALLDLMRAKVDSGEVDTREGMGKLADHAMADVTGLGHLQATRFESDPLAALEKGGMPVGMFDKRLELVTGVRPQTLGISGTFTQKHVDTMRAEAERGGVVFLDVNVPTGATHKLMVFKRGEIVIYNPSAGEPYPLTLASLTAPPSLPSHHYPSCKAATVTRMSRGPWDRSGR